MVKQKVVWNIISFLVWTWPSGIGTQTLPGCWNDCNEFSSGSGSKVTALTDTQKYAARDTCFCLSAYVNR